MKVINIMNKYFLLFCVVSALIISCSSERSNIDLPNSYFLELWHDNFYGIYREAYLYQELDESLVSELEKKEFDDDMKNEKTFPLVLGGNVTQYAITYGFVLGLCEEIPGKASREVLGYFVINTKTNEVWKGLTNKRFHDLIK